MYKTKKWYESKGVWGGVVSIAAVAVGFFGYTMSPEDQQQIAMALSGVGTTIGTIISVYGRIKATKRIDG